MSQSLTFQVDTGAGTIEGLARFPEASAPTAAVLVCRGVHVPADDATGLVDSITTALVAQGLAAVTYEPRCANLILDEFHAHTAAHDVDDAVGAYDWLAARPEVDASRIGVLGYSLGCIAASALGRRKPEIARLCLLGAMTAEHVLQTLEKPTGAMQDFDAERLPASYGPSLQGVDTPRDAAFHNRPALVLHGAADRLAPPEVALQIVRALESAARPVHHLLLARTDHACSGEESRTACVDQILQFFEDMPHASAAANGAVS